jgi:hypothetical protein
MAQTVTTGCGHCYSEYSKCGQKISDSVGRAPDCCPAGYTLAGDTGCWSCSYVNYYGEDIEGRQYICTKNAPPVNCFADSSQINNPDCYNSLNGHCTGSNLNTQLCKDFCSSHPGLCDARKLEFCTGIEGVNNWDYCAPLLQTYCSDPNKMGTDACQRYCSAPGGSNCSGANQWCQGDKLNQNVCTVFCRQNPGQCDSRLKTYCSSFTRSNAPKICGCFLSDKEYSLKTLNEFAGTNHSISCDKLCDGVLAPRPQGTTECGISTVCTYQSVVPKSKLESELLSTISITECTSPPGSEPNPEPNPTPGAPQKIKNWVLENPKYVVVIVACIAALIVLLK